MKTSETEPAARGSVAPVHLAIPDFEESGRWVRGKIGGETIVDSKSVMVLRRENRLPVYCFPRQDVRMDALRDVGFRDTSDEFGEVSYWNIETGAGTVENAAWEYSAPPAGWEKVKDYVMVSWAAMDAWFEEEEEVFVHSRDPFHRVDVIPSSRKIKIMLGGVVIAESSNPSLLFETGIPTRYYLPRKDVRMDFLESVALETRCPYKGVASYWSASVGDKVFENIVWSYPDPIGECPKLKDLLCFYNEKVDAIYVDGELETKPVTKWS